MKKMGWTYEFSNLISPEKVVQLKRYFHIINVLYPETIELGIRRFLISSPLKEIVVWFKEKNTYSLVITKKDIFLINMTENGKVIMALKRKGYNVRLKEKPKEESAILKKILYEII